MEPDLFLSQQYLAFEAKSMTWLHFLESIIPVFEAADRTEEVELFQEFAEVIRTTSYPEEKSNYQSVEIHCEYSAAIDALRATL